MPVSTVILPPFNPNLERLMCSYTTLGRIAPQKPGTGLHLIPARLTLADSDRPVACYVYSGLSSGQALGEALATIVAAGTLQHRVTIALVRRGFWELIVTTLAELLDRLELRL